MRNRIQNFPLKVCGIGIFIFLILFFIGCFSTDRLTKKEWSELMEDLRLRKNSLELEKSYLKKVLLDSLLIDSLIIELKKCEEEIELLKKIDTLITDEVNLSNK